MTSPRKTFRTCCTITPAVALHYIESPPTWHYPAEPELSSNHRTSTDTRMIPYPKTSKEQQFGEEIWEDKQKATTSSLTDLTNIDPSTLSKKIAFGYTSE